MSAVLFIHGGAEGAFRYDQKIVARLQEAMGPDTPIDFPLIEGLETLDWALTARELGGILGDLPAGGIVVAHSVGAAAMLKLLPEIADPGLRHLFLLAAPYNGPDGDWGDGDFALTANFARRLPKALPVTFYHSEDDEMIPVESAHRYADRMPAAKVVILHGYGHQFTRSLEFLAKAIREVAR